MKPITRQPGLRAIETIEEAAHLLRTAPLATLAVYYLGSMPFVLALLWFWGDMSQSAFAERHVGLASLVLAAAFVWMKTWQAVYARGLRALAQGVPAPRLTVGRLWRSALVQLIVQPSGMVVLPISFIAMLPFGWVYAWYQNVTVFGDGETSRVTDVMQRAMDQARFWPKQNHVIIWLVSPFMVVLAAILMLVMLAVAEVITPDWTVALLYFYTGLYAFLMIPLCPLGVAVAVNIGLAIQALPWLFHALTGIELAVNQGGDPFNSTFFAMCCAFTYLVMDPVVKAVYTLRCFYGESTKSGADLTAELTSLTDGSRRGAARLAGLALMAVFLCVGMARADDAPSPPVHAPLAASSAPAVPTPSGRIDPENLDQQIDRVLSEANYTWRMPRGGLKPAEEGVLSQFMGAIWDTIGSGVEKVLEWVRRFFRWLFRHIPEPKFGGQGIGFSGLPKLMMWFLVALAAGVLLVFVVKTLMRRRRTLHIHAVPLAVQPPDIADEGIGADALPEDGWLAMARDLMDRGELRLAVRALFLAGLAHLARREMILLAKYKSNHEYEGELRHRAHAEPVVLDTFARNVTLFERVWYGVHEATGDLVGEFSENQKRMTAIAHER